MPRNGKPVFKAVSWGAKRDGASVNTIKGGARARAGHRTNFLLPTEKEVYHVGLLNCL